MTAFTFVCFKRNRRLSPGSAFPLSKKYFLSGIRHRLIRFTKSAHRVGANGCRASHNRCLPALYFRKVVQQDRLAFAVKRPRVAGHIGDAVLRTGNEFTAAQLLVQHAVQAPGFVLIALDCVCDFFWRIGQKMVILPKHRPKPRHLPK